MASSSLRRAKPGDTGFRHLGSEEERQTEDPRAVDKSDGGCKKWRTRHQDMGDQLRSATGPGNLLATEQQPPAAVATDLLAAEVCQNPRAAEVRKILDPEAAAA